MSDTQDSAANSGTATAVTLSSLAAQLNKVYNLVVVVFVFMILVVVASVTACLCIWLRKRKTNKTVTDPERAIPLADIHTRRQVVANINTTRPAPPARHPGRPIKTPPPPMVPSSTSVFPAPSTQGRHAHPKRSQTAPLPLHQRPVLNTYQSHGTDYSSGRPRRFGEDHLANSGPSASANVHNNSAFGNPGSKKMDKINNS